MRRTVLLTFFLVVSMIVVGSVEGIAGGKESPRYSCDFTYTPSSEVTTFRFSGQTPIDMAGLYYALVTYHTKPVSVEVSDKEVLAGWHTTCIGASFAQKGPIPEKPKLAPPPPPPEPVKPTPPPEPVKPTPPPPPTPLPEPVKPVSPPPPILVPVVVPPQLPPKVKDSPVFANVPFDYDKSMVNPFASKVLDQNAEILKSNPNIKVELGGHTDIKEPKSFGEKRSISAKKYLMDKFNISDYRLATKNYGSTKPIAEDSTLEGRAKNRRVEFIIISQ